MPRAVIDEAFVHLIGEDKEIMLDCDLGKRFEFTLRKDLARRVRWAVENDRACARRDRSAQAVEVKGKFRRRQLNNHRRDAHGMQRADVIAVERLKHHALVAWIQQRQQGSIQRARGPTRHEYLRIRVYAEPVEARKLLRDRIAQRRDAVEPSIDILAGTNRLDRCLDHRMRWVGIADALRHVDAADVRARDRHGAYLRLDKVRRQFTKTKIAGGRGRNYGHRKGALLVHAFYLSEIIAVREAIKIWLDNVEQP